MSSSSSSSVSQDTAPTVVGPIRVVHIRAVDGTKNILLCGETHEEYFKCMTGNPVFAADFIEDGIGALAKFGRELDVYVEAPFVWDDEKWYDLPASYPVNIHSLRHRWREGLQKSKLQVPWKTARFHYVDMRVQAFGSRNPDLQLMEAMAQIAYDMAAKKEKPLDESNAHYVGVFKEAKSLEEPMRRAMKFDKQLAHIASPRTRDVLNKVFKEELVDKLALVQKYFRSRNIGVDKQPGEMARQLLWLTHILVQDLYALSRMLRTFKRPLENRQVVFYGGDLHAQTLVRLLLDERYLLHRPPPLCRASEPGGPTCVGGDV